MNCIVHGNEEQSCRGFVRVRMPAEEQDSNVVVPMQKNQRSLADDDEECVEEFKRFREDE